MRSAGQPSSDNNRRCVATSCDNTVDTRPYPTNNPSPITPTEHGQQPPEHPTPELGAPSTTAGDPTAPPHPRTTPTAEPGPAHPDPQGSRPPQSPTPGPHAP